jgi:hypothetical protein
MTKPTTGKGNAIVADPRNPVVDLDRISEVYAELKTMSIHLDPNPIDLGPRRFNNRIAQVRAMLTRVDQLFLQISEDLHYYKRQINAKKTIYELEKRDLMVNDPKCRVGRAQGERADLADVQMRPQIEELHNLELASVDLETLITVVHAKRTDLKDIQSRMRDQMRLIEHDIGMGARWGDRTPGQNVSTEADGLDALIQDVDSKMGWKSDDERSTPEPVEVDEEESAETEEVVTTAPAQEPVLEFDPADEVSTIVIDDTEMQREEISLPSALMDDGQSASDAKGEDLPDASTSEEEVDDFLSSISATTAMPPKGRKKAELMLEGIDDLIASLAND